MKAVRQKRFFDNKKPSAAKIKLYPLRVMKDIYKYRVSLKMDEGRNHQ